MIKFIVVVDPQKKVFTVNGNIKTLIDDEKQCLFLDGWLENDIRILNKRDLDKNLVGVFNIIFFDKENGEIIIKNDLLGQRQLYIHKGINEVIISNNFWEIFKISKDFSLNQESINCLKYFRRLSNPKDTFLKQVFRLPPSSVLKLTNIYENFEFFVYNNLTQKSNKNISAPKAADELYESILNQLLLIKSKNRQNIWFGNSGGLDSRIIPAIAKKINLKVNGFIISNNKFLYTNNSLKASREIAKIYDFENLNIDFRTGDAWKRLIRDIFVNPFGPADYHKNAKFEYFKDSLILCGGNSFLIANDNNLWKDNKEKTPPIFKMINKHLIRSQKKTSPSIYLKYENDLLKIIHEVLGCKSTSFDQFRLMHQFIFNITSPAGAFESMNMAGDFQYIYHPFATVKSTNWNENLFYDRKVQYALFNKYFPELLNIKDQHGEYPKNYLKKDSFLTKKINLIKRKLFNDGLDYKNWKESKWHKDFEKLVLNFISKNGCEESLSIFNQRNDFHNPQDTFDYIKLSVTIILLKNKQLAYENF